MAEDTFHIIVAPEQSGSRLDRILAGSLQDISRARLQDWIKQGQVKLFRQQAEISNLSPSATLREGDEVFVQRPANRETQLMGEPISLDILFEDEHVLVLNKQAGMVVHPSAGHDSGTLVHALIAHCGDSLAGIGGEKRPGIVHRLDKDTSGVMIVAKHDVAHQRLGEQFKAHGRDGRMQRIYHAFVWGNPIPVSGSVNAALARSPHNRLKMAVSKHKQARQAITNYRRLAHDAAEKISLVECRLETGRTHQIRVHMSHLGFPVIADTVYGPGMRTKIETLAPDLQAAVAALSRQALHAKELGFEHPESGESMHFTTPLPHDMAAIAKFLS
jgi:23S rRNA pseudouridine1911/1915/1917 synthase